MHPWLIPMFYVAERWLRARAAAHRAGISLLHVQFFGGLGAGSPIGRSFGHDGADGHRIRHGLRHGAIQRDRLFPSAGALVCARPGTFSFTGGIHGHVHLCPVHARLDGSGRIGNGAAIFHPVGRDHDHFQHVAFLPADAAHERPSDHERASPGWRPRPQGHPRHVPALDDRPVAQCEIAAAEGGSAA